MQRELYFAYGSNMSTRALQRRCPGAELVATGVLPEHRLIFFLEDQSWSGVAGVLPARGLRVEGVVWSLEERHLLALDDYEDLASGDYVRERREVELLDGGTRACWIYLPGRDWEVPVPPSRAYLEVLLDGAREHGLALRAELEERLRR